MNYTLIAKLCCKYDGKLTVVEFDENNKFDFAVNNLSVTEAFHRMVVATSRCKSPLILLTRDFQPLCFQKKYDYESIKKYADVFAKEYEIESKVYSN